MSVSKMDSKEIIELIRVHKKELEKFGVKKIGIFGSFTRDETSEESDIDIVVEFERGKGTFKNFGGLVEYLENLFGRSVDILTPTGIESIRSDEIKKSIKQGIIYV
ncbi:nucleotidyltransferase family protein [Archaeoglobus neptunius]|uniref:nucleotidyltransferase family protein n=1 Tax=Archaeoglobus neptunius TaxID=2798580 RepID=UPI001E3CE43A|nr:nucleotidyltransferase family protein [Archaeoglobus neptunius]